MQNVIETPPAVQVAGANDSLCPLCEYDLRGAVEPRCPECGYHFTWEELRDPKLRLHRYLFEHHPERNLRCFLRTLLGSLRPRKFWSELHPTQPSRPKRLALYALLYNLFPLLFLLLITAAAGFSLYTKNLASRNAMLPLYGNDLNAPVELKAHLQIPMTLRDYFEQDLPLPPRWPFFAQLLSQLRPLVLVVLTLVAWPWIALATLMIFSGSMRKAKVKTHHVMRCVLYSADLIVWCTLLLLWIPIEAFWLVIHGAAPHSLTYIVTLFSFAMAALLMLLVFPYRLAIAYRRYLRFDHAIATVLIVQFVVVLAQMVLLCNLLWFR